MPRTRKEKAMYGKTRLSFSIIGGTVATGDTVGVSELTEGELVVMLGSFVPLKLGKYKF